MNIIKKLTLLYFIGINYEATNKLLPVGALFMGLGIAFLKRLNPSTKFIPKPIPVNEISNPLTKSIPVNEISDSSTKSTAVNEFKKVEIPSHQITACINNILKEASNYVVSKEEKKIQNMPITCPIIKPPANQVAAKNITNLESAVEEFNNNKVISPIKTIIESPNVKSAETEITNPPIANKKKSKCLEMFYSEKLQKFVNNTEYPEKEFSQLKQANGAFLKQKQQEILQKNKYLELRINNVIKGYYSKYIQDNTNQICFIISEKIYDLFQKIGFNGSDVFLQSDNGKENRYIIPINMYSHSNMIKDNNNIFTILDLINNYINNNTLSDQELYSLCYFLSKIYNRAFYSKSEYFVKKEDYSDIKGNVLIKHIFNKLQEKYPVIKESFNDMIIYGQSEHYSKYNLLGNGYNNNSYNDDIYSNLKEFLLNNPNCLSKIESKNVKPAETEITNLESAVECNNKDKVTSHIKTIIESKISEPTGTSEQLIISAAVQENEVGNKLKVANDQNYQNDIKELLKYYQSKHTESNDNELNLLFLKKQAEDERRFLNRKSSNMTDEKQIPEISSRELNNQQKVVFKFKDKSIKINLERISILNDVSNLNLNRDFETLQTLLNEPDNKEFIITQIQHELNIISEDVEKATINHFHQHKLYSIIMRSIVICFHIMEKYDQTTFNLMKNNIQKKDKNNFKIINKFIFYEDVFGTTKYLF